MDNLYILAMELGERSLDKGISYNDARNYFGLKERNFKEHAFRNWFYSNFYNADFPPFRVITFGIEGLEDATHTKPSYLTGDAHMKLIEYRELQEARQDALKAQKDTKTATLLAVTSLIIGVIVGVIQIYYEAQF